MDWMEKGRKELEEHQQKEKAIQANIDSITKSGILDKIEKERLAIQKETIYFFFLIPGFSLLSRGQEKQFDPNRFERGRTWYQVMGPEAMFEINVNEVGIDLKFFIITGLRKGKMYEKRIDPTKITDKEIHAWFGFLVDPRKTKIGVLKEKGATWHSVEPMQAGKKTGSLIEFLSSCIMGAFRK